MDLKRCNTFICNIDIWNRIGCWYHSYLWEIHYVLRNQQKKTGKMEAKECIISELMMDVEKCPEGVGVLIILNFFDNSDNFFKKVSIYEEALLFVCLKEL